MLSIQIALWLEVTCLFTAVFIGSPQWVIPTALSAFVAHGFWIETGLALCMSGWITLSLIGLLKTGFSRYLSLASIAILLCLTGLFLLGYLVFSWIYLDQLYGFEGLTHLFWQRYQEPMLWHQFIQTE